MQAEGSYKNKQEYEIATRATAFQHDSQANRRSKD
jgi:hypothetical protein